MSTKLNTPFFGALFENGKKVEGSKSPDFTGNMGEDKSLLLSAWYSEDQEGLSLKVSSKNDSGFQERGLGELRTNTEKKAENHPDVVGSITIDDVVYDLSGWNRLAKTTQKAYISLKVTEPYVKGQKHSNSGGSTQAQSKPQAQQKTASAPAPSPASSSKSDELDDIFDFSKE